MADTINEQWSTNGTSLPGWEVNEATKLTVNSNGLYSTGNAIPSAFKAFTPGVGNFRIATSIQLKTEAGAEAGKAIYVGTTSQTSNAEFKGWVGIGLVLGGEAVFVKGITKEEIGGKGKTFTEGTYLVTIIGDSSGVSYHIVKSDRSVEAHKHLTLAEVVAGEASGGTEIKKLWIMNTDKRGTATGTGVRPIGAREDLHTLETRTNIEGLGARSYYTKDEFGNETRLEFPSGYASGTPPKAWVLCAHGVGGEDPAWPLIQGGAGPVYKELLENNYGIVSSTNGGSKTLGNETAYKSFKGMYELVKTRYDAAPYVAHAFSAGSLAASIAVTKEMAPFSAMLLISGFINLEKAKEERAVKEPYIGFYKDMETAYGVNSGATNYTEKVITPELDPGILGFAKFKGIPVGVMSSPEDTTAVKSLNAELLKTKLEGHGVFKEVVTSGAHASEANFKVAATLALMNELLESVPVVTKPSDKAYSKEVAITPFTLVASNSPTEYKQSGLPTGLALNGATGEVTGTPTAAVASYPVEVWAKNASGESAHVSFAIEVTAKPKITKPADQVSETGKAVTPVKPAAAGAALTWSAEELPEGISISSSTGEMTGTPGKAEAEHIVRLKITSANGGTDSANIKWTVNAPAGEAAATISKPETQSTKVKASVSLAVTGAHIVALTAKELPAGLSLSKTSQTEWKITGEPTVIKAITTVTLEARNAESVGENVTFSWTITAGGSGKFSAKTGTAGTMKVSAVVSATGQTMEASLTAAGSYTPASANELWLLQNVFRGSAEEN